MNKRKSFMSAVLSVAVLAGVISAAPAATADTPTPQLAFTKMPVNPTINAQKTAAGKQIQDMAIMNGELYTGYGDYSANTGPINVTSMNIANKTFKNWVSTPNEAILNYRVINGKLYAPQIDPRLAWNANVGYATNASGSWVNVNTTPFIHIYDVATTDGNDLWLSGSVSLSDGKTPDGAAIKRSTDGGKTWTTVKEARSVGGATAVEFDRYYWLGSAAGKIYARPQLTKPEGGVTPALEVWENGAWSTVTTAGNSLDGMTNAGAVQTFKDKIFFTQNLDVKYLDPATNTVSSTNIPLYNVRDFYVEGDTLYAVNYTSVARTVDGVNWEVLSTTIPNYATEAGFYAQSIAVDSASNSLFIAGANASVFRANLSDAKPLAVPTLSGADDVSFVAGTRTSFDVKAGVTATDPTQGDVTANLYVSGQPNVTLPGTYIVYYAVLNAQGEPVLEKSRRVTVTPASTPSAPVISGADNTVWYLGYEFGTFEPLNYVYGADTMDGDITSKITSAGTVDQSKTGVYPVTYTLTNSHNITTTVTRNVTIVDVNPEISGADDVTVDQGSVFDAKAGVKVYNYFDANVQEALTVTGSVDTKTPGTYTLTYSATSIYGYTGTATRVVTVSPATPATITGATAVTVEGNSVFDSKAGVTATDKIDGNITANITVAGTVNTAVAGDYKLTYSVVNSNGLVTTVERTVTVKAVVPPVVVEPNTAPVFGTTVISLRKNSVYNPMTAITVTDKEDGVITNFTYTTNVNTAKPGKYVTTYTATDSQGLTTVKVLNITVLPI